MPQHIKIRKGLDIKLKGEAEKFISPLPYPETIAFKPSNFTGVNPRLLVKEGDEVQAGSCLFHDKSNEAIKFCSPVSGEVVEVLRGEKRKILQVKVLADKEINYLDFKKTSPSALNREAIIQTLLDSGFWPFIRQRPFGIIANPLDKPKAIFISAFDSNPLAPDNDFIMKEEGVDFQTGLDAVIRLTEGSVHLNVHSHLTTSPVFTEAKGVRINRIAGPHPAGNVGVQIHHIDPLNKGEVIWYLYPQDLVAIGRLFNHGRFDVSRVVAVTGSRLQHPRYYKTIAGSAVNHMLSDSGMKTQKNRIISGNVLTGKRITGDGYLDFYDYQLTVIPEGDEPEFMGWLAPGFNKLSASRAFFSWLTPAKKHDLNTNMHGEERPFVVTGEYEKVFPMDIYPVQLLKSILIEDIELMEQLGIYEVVEEDFALCEFICTSKIESQDIIRKGIDLIRREMV